MFLDDPTKRFLVNERFERHNGTGKNAPKGPFWDGGRFIYNVRLVLFVFPRRKSGMAYVDLIRYNHYKSKSVADWNEKVTTSSELRCQRTNDHFRHKNRKRKERYKVRQRH
jgi:hypothetical protein